MLKILFLLSLLEAPAPRAIRALNIGQAMSKQQEHLFYLSFRLNPSYKAPNNTFFMSYSLPVLGHRGYTQLQPYFSQFHILAARLSHKIAQKLTFPDILVLEKKKIEKTIKNIIIENNIDVVVAFAVPHSFLELGSFVKNLGCKWIVDVGDPLSHNVADTNTKQAQKKLRYEKKYLEIADAVITTNEATSEYYHSILDPQKMPIIKAIYAGIPSKFVKTSRKTLSENRIKMIYAGAFYPNGVRDPRTLLSIVEKNTFSSKSIELSVYGFDSNRYRHLVNTAFFVGRIPQTELYQKYIESDVLLFIDNKLSIQVPSKLFELLALKRPVLFIYDDKRSPSVKIAQGYSHVFFSKNNEEEIKSALLKCITKYNTIEYNYPAEENTWEKRSEQFLEVIKQTFE